MRTLLCLLAVALCGCKSISSVRAPAAAAGNRGYIYGQPPAMKATAEEALPTDFEGLISLAQSLAVVAENDPQPQKRLEAAKRGIMAGRQARALAPERVEGHYWYAVHVGFLADVDRSYGLSAVAEMEPALKKAIELDEKYDYAGPLRVLGVLLTRTPPPPVSIGSPRKGLRLLQRAVEQFPEYPENYLYLGEALRDNGRADEARAAWQKLLTLPAPPRRETEFERWRQEARKRLAEAKNG